MNERDSHALGMINRHIGLIVRIAGGFLPSCKALGMCEEREDLEQIAKLHLWRVADRYDPKRAEESTFVGRHTKYAIMGHMRPLKSATQNYGVGIHFTDEVPDAPQEPAQENMLYLTQVFTSFLESLVNPVDIMIVQAMFEPQDQIVLEKRRVAAGNQYRTIKQLIDKMLSEITGVSTAEIRERREAILQRNQWLEEMI